MNSMTPMAGTRVLLVSAVAADRSRLGRELKAVHPLARLRQVPPGEPAQAALAVDAYNLLLVHWSDLASADEQPLARLREQAGPYCVLLAYDTRWDAQSATDAMAQGAHDWLALEQPALLRRVLQRELGLLDERRQSRHCAEAAQIWERRYLTRLDRASDAVAHIQNGTHVYANSAYAELFGLQLREQVVGLAIEDLVAEEDRSRVHEAFGRCLTETEVEHSLTVHGLRPDGAPFNLVLTLAAILIGGEARIELTVPADPARQTLDETIRYLSRQDLLTGLFNRQYFIEELGSELNRVDSAAGRSVLVYLLVPEFKTLQADIGVPAADLLITDLANLIRRCLPAGDVAARFADDVFALSVRGRAAAEELARTLLHRIAEQPFELGGRAVDVRVGIGLLALDERCPDAPSALAAADRAAHEATAGVQGFAWADVAHLQARGGLAALNWAEQLALALAQDRFELAFQPIVPLHGSEGQRYEVLLRLRDGQGGVIPAGEFMAGAARANLLPDIDRWVVRHALATLKTAVEQTPTLFVKLSGASLANAEFGHWLMQELEAKRPQAGQIVFEVTEVDALERLRELLPLAQQWKRLGCALAIEHLGHGPRSVQLLRHVPARYVKLHGQLIRNLADDPLAQERTRVLIEAAHESGKETIAVLVELAQTLSLLWRFNVRYTQGYFLQPPQSELCYEFGAL